MATVRTDKELGKALKNGADEIIIEGDLKKKVLRIKATGKVAWGVAIGAIGVIVLALLAAPETAGTSSIIGAASFAPAAAAVGGADVAVTAIGIAVAAGGIGALNKLRNYKIVEKTSSRVVLHR